MIGKRQLKYHVLTSLLIVAMICTNAAWAWDVALYDASHHDETIAFSVEIDKQKPCPTGDDHLSHHCHFGAHFFGIVVDGDLITPLQQADSHSVINTLFESFFSSPPTKPPQS